MSSKQDSRHVIANRKLEPAAYEKDYRSSHREQPRHWVAKATLALICCMVTCMPVSAQTAPSGNTEPGATDPIPQPSRRTIFPQDKILYSIPVSGFDNSSNPYTITSGVIQLDNPQENGPAITFSAKQNTISATGRFVDPSLEQLVLAQSDAGNNGVNVTMRSGKYPTDLSTFATIGQAGLDFPHCRASFAFGQYLALAAGDLDGNVDANGNRHDELVLACRNDTLNPTPSDASAPSDISLYVIDYSAWNGDTAGTYDPTSSVQNNYAPAVTSVAQTQPAQQSVYTGPSSADDFTSPNDSAIRIAIGDFDGNGENEIAMVYGTAGNAFVVSLYSYSNDGKGNRTLKQISTATLGGITNHDKKSYYELPHFSVAAGDFDGNGVIDRIAVARVIGENDCDTGPFSPCREEFSERLDILDFQSNTFSIGDTETFSGSHFENSTPSDRTKYTKAEVVSGLFKYDPADTGPPNATTYNYNRRELALVFNGNEGIQIFPISVYQDTVTYLLGKDQDVFLPRYFNGFIGLNTFTLVASQFTNFNLINGSSTPTPQWKAAVAVWIADPKNKGQTVVAFYYYDFSTCPAQGGNKKCAVVAGPSGAGSPVSDVIPAILPFLPYDYAGNSVYLGAPIHLEADNVQHYDMIIQEPPKHTYYLEPDGNTAGSVVNISNYDVLTTTLNDTTGKSLEIQKQHTFNWGIGTSASVSASATASASVGVGKVSATTQLNASINYDHTSNDTKTNDQLNKDTLSYVLTTPYDDALTLTTQTFDIWRYRVFGPQINDSNAFVDFVIPGPYQSAYEGGTTDDNYQPIYENGNILSYPHADPAVNAPDLGTFSFPDASGNPTTPQAAQALTLPDQVITIGGTTTDETVSLSSTLTNANNIVTTNSEKDSVDLKQSIEAEATVPEVGGGKTSFSVDLGASSSLSWSNSTTSTTTLSTAMSIEVTTGKVGNLSNPYGIWPAFYVTPGGTLKFSYGVDLSGEGFGVDPRWGKIYGSLPDPALNLPQRFIVDTSNTTMEVWKENPNPERRKVRGFWLFQTQIDSVTGTYPYLATAPSDGDQVRIEAVVYNYSTAVPIGGTNPNDGKNVPSLDVQFQIIGWDPYNDSEQRFTTCPGNTKPASDPWGKPNGRCIVGSMSRIFLQPLQSTMASVDWNTTGFGQGGADSYNYHIYVVLDPHNKIAETYESDPTCPLTTDLNDCPTDPGQNNEGYGNAQVMAPGTSSQTFLAGSSQMSSALNRKARRRHQRDLRMEADALGAMDHRGGLRFGTVQAYVGRPLRIRVGTHTDQVVDYYSPVWVWEGDGSKLIASKKLQTGNRKGDFAWLTWTPPAEGTYTLHARVFEEGDDTNKHNNTSHLEVIAIPVPPANRR